jgi:hypothetical protein
MFELRPEPLCGPAVLSLDDPLAFGSSEQERSYIMASVRAADLNTEGQPVYDWVQPAPSVEEHNGPAAVESVGHMMADIGLHDSYAPTNGGSSLPGPREFASTDDAHMDSSEGASTDGESL